MASKDALAPTAGPVITDETRKVSELKPDPKNPRKHPESQIAGIIYSIENFGFVHRIVIKPNGMIIAGHGTFEAIKRLDRETVEVRVIAGLTESKYKQLALALNKLPENSDWNDDLLREILGEVQEEGGDLASIGFSPKELDSILGEDNPIEVKEIETGKVEDEFWISVRGPLKDQAGALKALETAMKPYSGISVELGTINIG